MTTDALFDPDDGERRKREGMADAEAAERVTLWRVNAIVALDQLAATRVPFTADDLVARVGLPDAGVNKNNSVGAVMNGAAKAGVIRKTGDYRPSTRTAAHRRIVAVWVGVDAADRTAA